MNFGYHRPGSKVIHILEFFMSVHSSEIPLRESEIANNSLTRKMVTKFTTTHIPPIYVENNVI